VGDKTQFTVETFSAGKGTVDVLVENPKGKAEPVRMCMCVCEKAVETSKIPDIRVERRSVS